MSPSSKNHFFLFVVPFLALLSLLFPQFYKDSYDFLRLFIVIYLSKGHVWAPLLLIVFSKIERKKVLDSNPQIFVNTAILACIPLVLFCISALFHFLGFNQLQFVFIGIYGLVYFSWNSFHFAQQQFGILRMMKRGMNYFSPNDRKIDLIFSHILLSIIPAAIWLSIGIRNEFVSSIFGYPYRAAFDIEGLKPFFFYVILLYLGWSVLMLFLKRNCTWGFVQNISIAVQCFGIISYPIFFTVILFTSIHWFQELYLISRYQAEEKEGYFLVSLLTLIGLGALGFSLIQSFEIKNNFLIYGGIQGFINLSPLAYLGYAILAGFLAAPAFAHFYVDKWVHKGKA